MGSAGECVHCDREIDGLFVLPSGDFYLCHTCYENALDFVGDPTTHHWETVHVAIEGRGSDSTYVVERCRICGHLRVDESVKVIEQMGIVEEVE